MKVVASTDDYTIYLRRDGRHAVQSADKAPINGADKVNILLEHGLITAAAPKAPEPEAEEVAAEAAAESSEEGGDEASAEASAEEGGEEATDEEDAKED